MKRNLALFTMLAASLFVLTGCSSKTAVLTGNNQNTQNAQNTQANATAGGNRRMLDYGQPDRPADVRGVVKSIVGNEATILEIATPVGGRRASSTPQNGVDSSTGSPATISLGGAGVTGGAPGGNRGGGFAMGGGAGGPGGPGGGQGGAGGQGGTTNRAAMLAQLEKSSTGETKIIIPVGIKMLKPSVDASTKKREMVEASLTDITADKFITIWLNTTVTDKKVADFILIN